MIKTIVATAGLLCLTARGASSQTFERQVLEISQKVSGAALRMRQNIAASRARQGGGYPAPSSASKSKFEMLESDLSEEQRDAWMTAISGRYKSMGRVSGTFNTRHESEGCVYNTVDRGGNPIPIDVHYDQNRKTLSMNKNSFESKKIYFSQVVKFVIPVQNPETNEMVATKFDALYASYNYGTSANLVQRMMFMDENGLLTVKVHVSDAFVPSYFSCKYQKVSDLEPRKPGGSGRRRGFRR